MDCSVIINQAESENTTAYAGIARILKTYILSETTDLMGDIPYFATFQGTEMLNPPFDPQEQIYNDLFEQLNTAINELNGANPDIEVNGDLIYDGDLQSWIRAANTLKMKLYLQIRLRDPQRAANEINNLINEGEYIQSNDQDFQFNFATAVGNQHPLYDFAYNNRPGDIAISQFFIDQLRAVNDPRIGDFLNNQGQADYLGFPNNGAITPPGVGVRARPGRYIVGNGGEGAQQMLTHFQTQFILAEAALTLGTTGDPRTYFENAMRASMEDVGIPTAEADTYIANRLAAYDAATNDQEHLAVIMRDKWAAQFLMSVEAYTDFRRTGYPALTPVPDQSTINPGAPNGQIPVRLPYSSRETQVNDAAPPQPQLNVPVWWDVN